MFGSAIPKSRRAAIREGIAFAKPLMQPPDRNGLGAFLFVRLVFQPLSGRLAPSPQLRNIHETPHQLPISQMRRRRYHSISNIVATVYCEQQAIFDRERGEVRTMGIRVKAAAGTFEHKRFELEGKTRAAVDRRCFIASAVYGIDAPETNDFRAWRDRVLMHSRLGRTFVRIYYVVSPHLLPLLERSAIATAVVRRALNCILDRIGGDQ